MSTDTEDINSNPSGFPELTPLGRRIELLRFERRMSKRILAQRAGTSRQQLWRVMTGKSELTSSLCARLSEVLETDSRFLRDAAAESVEHYPATRGHERTARDNGDDTGALNHKLSTVAARDASSHVCQTLEDYISGPNGIERTFATLPVTSDGRRLKRVLLDAIEDIAVARSLRLPQAIFDLRRAVVNDDGA